MSSSTPGADGSVAAACEGRMAPPEAGGALVGTFCNDPSLAGTWPTSKVDQGVGQLFTY